mgnify:CR=1 FL=1
MSVPLPIIGPNEGKIGIICLGVRPLAVETHLIVEVGARRIAGVAHGADGLPLGHQLPLAHRPRGHVGVEGGGAVPVVDDHEVAVGPVGSDIMTCPPLAA